MRIQLSARVATVLALCCAFVVLGCPPSQAASTTASADASDISDEQALAEKFAPMVHLVEQPEPCGAGEPYQPSDVDPMLGNDSIALRGPWTDSNLVAVAPTAEDLSRPLNGYALDLPGNPLKPGCTYEEWANRVWKDSPFTVYAHVVTQADRPGELALQYWFWYPYNDFNNKHEGDWERIQLEFNADDAASALDQLPTQTIYSQHEGAERADWGDDKLEIADGTHPAVYVSSGSHASRYSSGLFLLRSTAQGFGCDVTLDPADGVLPVVKTIPSDPTEARTEFPWISYKGAWGQLETVSFYSGASGPSSKQQWTKPFTWSDEAVDTSYSVPGGSVYGVKTTDFFCSVIGKGSVLLLRYTDNPVPTLLLLALVSALVVWLVRRTSWDGATSVPLRRRRDAGQTIVSAWAMYRAHRWLFLCIGLVVAALSFVSGLIQQLVADAPVSGGGSDSSWLEGLLGLAGSVVLILAVFVSSSATVRAMAEIDAGRQVRARDAYRLAFGRFGALVITLLVAAAVMLPLLLSLWLAPLVLFLIAAWGLLVPVVQLEGLRGPAALLRSWRLARHQLFKVIGLLLFGLLLSALLGGLTGSIILVAAQAPFVLVNLVPGVVNALIGPFVALMMGYSYFHGLESDEPEPDEGVGEPALAGTPGD